MTLQLSGSFWVGGGVTLDSHFSKSGLNVLNAEPPQSIDDRLMIFKSDDRGFNSNGTGSSIQDVRNLVANLLIHVFGPGWTDITKRVGTGRSQRKIQFLKDLQRKGMAWATDT